jgi:hypothetical protein
LRKGLRYPRGHHQTSAFWLFIGKTIEEFRRLKMLRLFMYIYEIKHIKYARRYTNYAKEK